MDQCDKEACADSSRRLHVSERGGTAVERADRALSVYHRVGGGCIHPGIAGTGISRGRGEADISTCAADGAGFFTGCASPAAAAPGTSGTIAGDVPDATPVVSDGDVWICVFVVSDGRTAVGNMAGLPPGHRAQVADLDRVDANSL